MFIAIFSNAILRTPERVSYQLVTWFALELESF